MVFEDYIGPYSATPKFKHDDGITKISVDEGSSLDSSNRVKVISANFTYNNFIIQLITSEGSDEFKNLSFQLRSGSSDEKKGGKIKKILMNRFLNDENFYELFTEEIDSVFGLGIVTGEQLKLAAIKDVLNIS